MATMKRPAKNLRRIAAVATLGIGVPHGQFLWLD
jgi:hypothetical protein